MTAPAVLDAVPEAPAEPDAHVPSRRRFPWDAAGLVASCLVVLIAYAPILNGYTLSAAGNGRAEGTNGSAPFPGEPRPTPTDFRLDVGASTWQFEPWAEVTHRTFADGEIPLWNPYQAAGAPHAANMQSAVFDPLLLAVRLSPTPLTWDLSIIGAFVLGAAAAFLFGRLLGLRVIPAIVGSAAFSLSGWFFMYSNNHFTRAYAFLPLLFLLVELSVRSRRLLPVFGLGVAIAANIYVGMPEASFFVIGAAFVYAAVRLVQERSATPIHVSVARLGGAGVLGVALAAPVVLLFLEYEALSFNSHKSGLDRGAEADPAWSVLHLIVPWFPGAPEPPAGPRSWYGAVVVVASLVAVSGREQTKRLHAWFFFALGGLLVLKMYDLRVLEWVGHLPLFKQVVFPAFAAPVASFAFAVLAGIGVQVLWSRELRVRRFLALVGTLASVVIVALIAGDRLVAIVRDLQTVWIKGTFFALAAIGAAVLAARLGRRWGALLLTALILVELFWLAPFTLYGKRADPYVAPGWLALARTAQEGEPYSRVFALDGKLYPNTAGALGLQDIRMIDALYVGRYWRYVQTFVEPEAGDRFVGTEEGTPRLRGNPMLDALGARVILSVRDLSGVPELRLVGTDGDTRVYENSNAYPRAWVVRDVHAVRTEDEAFTYLESRADRTGSSAFDPRREAVVEHDGSAPPPAIHALQRGQSECRVTTPDEATIERYTSNSVTLRVRAACPGLLVLPDTYYPGWQATVNGRAQTIHPTDGAFRGVTVPEGESTVEFRYEPRAFPIGIALALIGLAVFAVVWIVSWWRKRAAHGALHTPP